MTILYYLSKGFPEFIMLVIHIMLDREVIVDYLEEHSSQVVAVKEGYLGEEMHNLNFEDHIGNK